EATRRLPSAPGLWLRLGIAQREIGSLEDAAASLGRVLELDPENAGRHAEQAAPYLALALIDLGRAPEAVEMARRALAWNERSVDAWIYLGLAQKATGDLPAARSSLEQAAALDPRRAETAYNLGSVALAAGDQLSAREYFLRALELRPDFAAAREILDRLQSGQVPAAATAPPATRGAPRGGLGAVLTEASYEEIGLRGLAVRSVEPGGAAARAGLQTGDLLLRADGRPLAKPQDLADLVRRAPRGQVVALDLLRGGRPLRISLRVD
ncbi:MAG TPA: PDZ domain-containing protein, partial [Thermoanaerobaculia bacterium]|nr:PDZ domain-containing protein [Thermoanaerobaculia bacterium]